MKRICLDARMLEHSGIGTYLQNLIPKISQERIKPILIISPSSEKKFPWLASYECIYCSQNIYSIGEQISLPYLIPSCDLFWTPHFNVPLFAIRAKKRLVTIHDLCHFAFFSSLNFMEKLYAKFVISQAVRRANWIITSSRFTCAEMERFFPKVSSKVTVIPFGVDAVHYSATGKEREILQKYSLPKKYFLFVGNLKPHKNLSGLLQALQCLLLENKEVFLVIVSKETTRTFFHLMQPFHSIKENVLWLNDVSNHELPYLYRLAQALVFPSFYEGFGLPPLEAMASSCPVIASHVASIPEICEDAAFYVNPYDSLTIKEAMLQILEQDSRRKSLIEKGKERILRFSWENTADMHVKVIESLL